MATGSEFACWQAETPVRPVVARFSLRPERFPVFLAERERGSVVYGAPDLGTGVEAGLHHGGRTARRPGELSREVVPADGARVREAVGGLVPDLATEAHRGRAPRPRRRVRVLRPRVQLRTGRRRGGRRPGEGLSARRGPVGVPAGPVAPVSDGPCPNCGATDPGRYCPECGQRQGDATRRLRFWIGRAVDETLSVDGRLRR